MNYRTIMEKSIDYIESNIKENLTAEMIAKFSGYSLYHFGRIFLAYYGMPVMEYVLKRRLSLAIHDIINGAKVLDTALLYGFETASGFSKAFRRHYQCSPKSFQKGMILELSDIKKKNHSLSKEQLLKDMRIEKREPFLVVGYSAKGEKRVGMTTKDVSALWNNAPLDDHLNFLYDKLDPPKHGEVGVFQQREDGAYYVLGVVVDDYNKVSPDMECIEIPESTYAVFTTAQTSGQSNPDAFVAIINATWRGIFDEWIEDSEFEYDTEKLDFEYYDERCHSLIDPVMEIWIPVKKRTLKNSENERK